MDLCNGATCIHRRASSSTTTSCSDATAASAAAATAGASAAGAGAAVVMRGTALMGMGRGTHAVIASACSAAAFCATADWLVARAAWRGDVEWPCWRLPAVQPGTHRDAPCDWKGTKRPLE